MHASDHTPKPRDATLPNVKSDSASSPFRVPTRTKRHSSISRLDCSWHLAGGLAYHSPVSISAPKMWPRMPLRALNRGFAALKDTPPT